MHENIYSKGDCKSLRIIFLKWKREERRFVELKIILILHCGNKVLKQVLNSCFKLDEKVARYGSSIKRSFLETVGITFLRIWILFKKHLMDCSIIPYG